MYYISYVISINNYITLAISSSQHFYCFKTCIITTINFGTATLKPGTKSNYTE